MSIDTTYGSAYPLIKHPLGFLHTSTGLDVIKADLMMLILTNPGERIMLPTFGTALRSYFFEPNDTTVFAEIEKVISTAISTWEPRITVENITVGLLDDVDANINDNQNSKEHILSINIAYYDPNHIAQIDNLVLNIPINQIGA